MMACQNGKFEVAKWLVDEQGAYVRFERSLVRKQLLPRQSRRSCLWVNPVYGCKRFAGVVKRLPVGVMPVTLCCRMGSVRCCGRVGVAISTFCGGWLTRRARKQQSELWYAAASSVHSRFH